MIIKSLSVAAQLTLLLMLYSFVPASKEAATITITNTTAVVVVRNGLHVVVADGNTKINVNFIIDKREFCFVCNPDKKR